MNTRLLEKHGGGTIKRPILVSAMLICGVALLLIIGGATAQSSVAPLNVKVTNKYVSANGYCSCGQGSYSYTGNHAFLNYCPYCKQYGTLHLECDPGDSPEGMWVCSNCDCDYCIQCGTNHGSQESLTPYTP